MSLRVIQLTDCHIPGDPAALYRGLDSRAGLQSLLPAVRRWAPDMVLATGDMSEDGHEDSYGWLAETFDSLDVPLMATPGNHDHFTFMAKHIQPCAVTQPLVHEGEFWQVIVLNSAVESEVPGRISAQQLASLNNSLLENSKPALLALHHQPVLVGSPWIDRFPLLEPGPLLETLERCPQVRAVVWGHVHQAFESKLGKVRAFGSPSTAINSLPGCERFTPDPAGPACRWLELHDDGRLDTGLLFATPD